MNSLYLFISYYSSIYLKYISLSLAITIANISFLNLYIIHLINRQNVTQFRGRSHRAKSEETILGVFVPTSTTMAPSPSFDVRHIFENGQLCSIESTEQRISRSAYVDLQCCKTPMDRVSFVFCFFWSIDTCDMYILNVWTFLSFFLLNLKNCSKYNRLIFFSFSD